MFIDFRHALRSLFRAPGFSFLSVFLLSIGIAVSCFAYALLHAVLYRAAVVTDQDSLMLVTSQGVEEKPSGHLLPVDFYRHLVANDSLARSISALQMGTVNISGDGYPTRTNGVFLDTNGMQLLGVQPIIGELWGEIEGPEPESQQVMISYRLWQDVFGGDERVQERVLRVNGEPARISGVMPEGFGFPIAQDLWLRIDLRSNPESGQTRALTVFARVQPGELAAMQATLSSVSGTFVRGSGENSKQITTAQMVPLAAGLAGPSARNKMYYALAAVALVLFIACANVSNLMSARVASRRQEMAVCVALGAGKPRLLRQLAMEIGLISSLSGLVGLMSSLWLLRYYAAHLVTGPSGYAPYGNLEFSWPLALFAIGASMLAALLFGLLPLYHLRDQRINEILRDGSRGNSNRGVIRSSQILAGAEIAISFVLLAAGVYSFNQSAALHSAELGFEAEGINTARLGFPEPSYPEETQRMAYFGDLLAALRKDASWKVALSSNLPGTYLGSFKSEIGEQAESASDLDLPRHQSAVISDRYFEALGLEMISGDEFSAALAGNSGQAIVDQAFARKYWPQSDPIGQTFYSFERKKIADAAEPKAWVVVGVAPDIMQGPLDAGNHGPSVYFPLDDDPLRFASLVISAPGSSESQFDRLRSIMFELDPDIPMYWGRSLADWLKGQLNPVRMEAMVFTGIAVVAILLAAFGAFAVMSYTVSDRTREIGIRQAMGASKIQIYRLVSRQTLWIFFWGSLLGLLSSILLAEVLTVGLRVDDAGNTNAYIMIMVLMAFIVVLATWLPFRRTVRSNPMTALRYE